MGMGLGDSTRLSAHIGLPEGLVLVSGDTAKTWRGSDGPVFWECVVHAPHETAHVIDVLVVSAIDSFTSESMSSTMSLEIDGNGVPAGTTGMNWAHRKVGTQLYRCGGPYPVPIDAADTLQIGDIATPMSVMSEPTVSDSTVLEMGNGSEELFCIVCVDRLGAVTDVTLTGKHALNQGLHDAVLDWLRTAWRFEPAQSNSGTAADCTELLLPVGPQLKHSPRNR